MKIRILLLLSLTGYSFVQSMEWPTQLHEQEKIYVSMEKILPSSPVTETSPSKINPDIQAAIHWKELIHCTQCACKLIETRLGSLTTDEQAKHNTAIQNILKCYHILCRNLATIQNCPATNQHCSKYNIVLHKNLNFLHTQFELLGSNNSQFSNSNIKVSATTEISSRYLKSLATEATIIMSPLTHGIARNEKIQKQYPGIITNLNQLIYFPQKSDLTQKSEALALDNVLATIIKELTEIYDAPNNAFAHNIIQKLKHTKSQISIDPNTLHKAKETDAPTECLVS